MKAISAPLEENEVILSVESEAETAMASGYLAGYLTAPGAVARGADYGYARFVGRRHITLASASACRFAAEAHVDDISSRCPAAHCMPSMTLE